MSDCRTLLRSDRSSQRYCAVPISGISLSFVALGFALSFPGLIAFLLFSIWLGVLSWLGKSDEVDHSTFPTTLAAKVGVKFLSFIAIGCFLMSCLLMMQGSLSFHFHGANSHGSYLNWNFDRIAQSIPNIQVVIVDKLSLEILGVLLTLWMLRCAYHLRLWIWKALKTSVSKSVGEPASLGENI